MNTLQTPTLRPFKNIIFDLGGVLLNISYQKTIDAFKALGIEDFEKIYSQARQTELFDAIETGKISPSEFLSSLQKSVPSASIADLEAAWNAMLLDFPEERWKLLKKLRHQYRIFLLSNTNEIHYKQYQQYIKERFKENFDNLFEKTYYSHLIGLRKPNPECFQFVLQDAQLKPEETLFIDDSIQHIEGARKTGIQSVHLSNFTINNLFSEK